MITTDRLPLDTASARFLVHLTGKNRSAGTLRAYGTDLRQFITWLQEEDISVHSPADVTSSHINEYLSYLGQRNLSGVSRARKLAAIKELFRYLVENDDLTRSPAEKISNPAKERKTRNSLHRDEYNKILALAGGSPRDYALFQVLLQTGVRVSELCNLTVSDVDLHAGMITIRSGKGKADREIVLEKKARLALSNYIDKRGEAGTTILFLNRYGEPLGDRGVRKLIARYTKEANISRKVSPHVFRHTFGTIKAEGGVSPFQLQQWLGHRNINTTQIYVHMSKEHSRKEMERTSL